MRALTSVRRKTHGACGLAVLGALVLAGLLAMGCGSAGAPTTGEPPLGASEFVSAAGEQGQQSQRGDENSFGAEEPASADGGGEERTVEEGDIYRVLGPNQLLNLNSYRGLQVIDLTDASNPTIVGRVAVTGYPVEMYVVGQRAFLLLNYWQGYYGTRTDVQVESYQGGLVVAVDISDPTNPVITGRAQVPGNIQASRLTRGGDKEALFVAASTWDGESKTVVRSFSVSAAGKLQEQTTLDLGGYVIDIQATPAALLVARYTWGNGDYSGTQVAIIDISDPEGTMVEGASVEALGWINNKTNMDLRGNVLRIASGGRWTGSGSNWIQTFDVTDIAAPLPLDQKSFAAGEDLYATLFLQNKAFCVTYERVDPFHAFAIDDYGVITEKAEYIISGWNDYFVPVFDQTRIIGIGVDDENGRSMAASLYDITDLSNPEPFLGRATVEFDYSWSEAQWDDRAFSVLEGAVSVPSGDGTTQETGLVLLPFQGYDSNTSTYRAAVQIFTFSENTLTLRGIMDHGSQVRRSFMQRNGVTANLSEQKLSLYDPTDPDQPQHLGSLDLAPNYMDFFVYEGSSGRYGARLKYDLDYYSWWGYEAATLPDNQLQIISLEGDPDTAAPVATVSLPAYAQLYQVGALAVAVTTTYVDNSDPPEYSTEIRVFDLSDPTAPEDRGTLVTDQIKPDWGYYYGWDMPVGGDCWNCGYYYPSYGSQSAKVAGQALVFPSRTWQSEVIGIEHTCQTYPTEWSNCWDGTGVEEGCYYYSGGITCTSLNGGAETCWGRLERCTYAADGDWSCEVIDASSVPTETHCYTNERERYWANMTLSILDLRDPDAPAMAPAVAMPDDEDDRSLLAFQQAVYVTYRVPVSIPGDSRDFVRYYFKKVDLTDPQQAQVGPGINIPGELLLVDGDTVYTRDFIWGENIVESAINRLDVVGGLAYLRARRRFVDQEVHAMLLDGVGHALISHARSYYSWGYGDVVVAEGGTTTSDSDPSEADLGTKLTIVALTGNDFPILSETPIDQWATLKEARVGRALFQVPGGLLVINSQNATAPFAQAYFPLQGWPSRLVLANRDIYIPAGPYGLYRFDLDAFNLLMPGEQ